MSIRANLSLIDRGGEEIIGDEPAERVADPLFVVGNDPRVRDRQAERTPEQSDDREPIGAGADHAGLRERAHIGKPGPVEPGGAGDDEDERHHHQQQCGDEPHPAQLHAPQIPVSRRRRRWRRRGGASRLRRRQSSMPSAASSVRGAIHSPR